MIRSKNILIFVLLAVLTSSCQAVVVAYYRFEEDIDGDANNGAVTIANDADLAGEPVMISSSAKVDISGGRFAARHLLS